MTIKELKSGLRVGRWIRTVWDDVGAKDGVVIYCDINNSEDWKIEIYCPFDEECCGLDSLDQIIEIGKYLTARDSGL
jgi:hypothetical protein